jgi:tRNA dimethylallyltransferase
MAVLIVLLGPTGIGKTDISIQLAKKYNAPIVSSDSRQFYRELKIGTAAPTEKETKEVEHFFIGSHSILDNYNAGQYEEDAINLLNELFKKHNVVLLVGGSMMYIDAVCNGLDEIPNVPTEIREFWQEEFKNKGLSHIQQELFRLDPKHYKEVDLKNPKRILHALEICLTTGNPYSDLRTGKKKKRNFEIIKIGLNKPRQELYEQINLRVDKMIEKGLMEEAKQYYPFKNLNTLNTVGYKELYAHFDGEITQQEAIDLIKKNTRNYAKRQLTWFNRDKEITWFHPKDEENIFQTIDFRLKDKK